MRRFNIFSCYIKMCKRLKTFAKEKNSWKFSGVKLISSAPFRREFANVRCIEWRLQYNIITITIRVLTIDDRMEVVSASADQRQHIGELWSTKMPRRIPRKIYDRWAANVAGQQHDYHQYHSRVHRKSHLKHKYTKLAYLKLYYYTPQHFDILLSIKPAIEKFKN